MRKYLCKFLGWHTPDTSLNYSYQAHCKYCGKDITKIKGRWRFV